MFVYLLKMSCNSKLFPKNVIVLPELLLKPDWINKKKYKELSWLSRIFFKKNLKKYNIKNS